MAKTSVGDVIRNIITKLKLDGEAEYKSGIKSVNAEMSTLRSELKLVESQYADNANSIEALTAKGEVLQKMLDLQNEKVALVSEQLQKGRDAYDDYGAKVSELSSKIKDGESALSGLDESTRKSGEQWAEYARQIQDGEAQLKKLSSSSKDTSAEQEKLEAEVAKARASMKELEESTGGAAKSAGELVTENTRLNAELETAQRRQQEAANSVNQLQREYNNAETEANKLNSAARENSSALNEAKNSADGTTKSLGDFISGLSGGNNAISALAGGLAAAGIAKSVKEITAELLECAEASATFETAVAKVSTLLDTTVVSLDSYKTEITTMSNEMGVSVNDLSEAVYQALSASVDSTEVIDFVREATMLSKAGFTDSATAVDIMTTALNAYQLEGTEAEKVASMLVKTQDLGKTSVADLAANMGRAIPTAAAYNVQLDNLSSSYALLTKNGINTRNATTYLSAMMDELASKSSEVSKALQNETGRSFSELMDAGYSLGDVIAILGENVSGNSTEFSNLWSSTTAAKAALTLFTSGADEFNATLEEMQNSSGMVATNYAIMADTAEMASNKLAAAGENLKITVGDIISPALTGLKTIGADMLEATADALNSWSDSIELWSGQTLKNLTATTTSLEEIGKKFQDVASANETTVNVAQKYVERLEELESQGLKTEAAQSEYAATVRNLNSLLPELNLQIDEQTGLVKDAREAVTTYTDAWLENARAQANQERIDDTWDLLIDAQKNYNIALDEYGQAQDRVIGLEVEREVKYQQLADAMGLSVEELQNLTAEQMELAACDPKIAALINEYNLLAPALNKAKSEMKLQSEAMEINAQTSQEAEAAYEGLITSVSDGTGVLGDGTDALDDNSAAAERMAAIVRSLSDSVLELSKESSALTAEEDRLTSALLEQIDTGELSLSTINSLIDSGYALALQIDDETGAVTLNRDMYIQLAQAKIDEQIASAQLDRQTLLDNLYAEAEAASTSRDAVLELANGNYDLAISQYAVDAAVAGAVSAYDANIAALQALKATVGQVTETTVTAGRKSSGSAKTAASETEEAAKKSLETYKNLKAELDHKKAMDVIDEEQYYKKLAAARDEYLLDAENLSEYRSASESIYAFEKKSAEQQLKLYKEYKSELDHEKAMDVINERDYYDKLALARDEYLLDAENLAEHWSVSESIYAYEKGLFEKAAEERLKIYETQIEEASEAAQEALSEISEAWEALKQKQDEMNAKLADYGELMKTVSATGRDGKKVDTKELSSLQEQIDVLNTYYETINALKDKGIASSLLDEVVSMGVDDAIQYGELLLAQTDDQWDEYNRKWEEKQQLAQEIAEQFYKDELDALENEYADKLAESLDGLSSIAFDSGMDTAQALIDGLKAKEAELQAQAEKLAEIARSALSTNVDGSHAGGLSYVPYDGYVAELHQGERVLTAAEAQAYFNASFPTTLDIPTIPAQDNSEQTAALINAIGTLTAGQKSTPSGDLSILVTVDATEFYRATIADFRTVQSENPIETADF